MSRCAHTCVWCVDDMRTRKADAEIHIRARAHTHHKPGKKDGTV